MESLTFIVAITVMAALTYPWISFGFIVAYWCGRFLFTLGYTKFGPNARLPGAIVMDLVIFGQLVLAIWSISASIKNYA